MSADVLRRAAALMRDRAEDASRWEPDRWWAHDGVIYGGTAAPHQVVTPLTTYEGDAEHIASWHPAVALAVADWLDAEADLSERVAEVMGRVRTVRSVTRLPHAVALAYLGEQS